MENQHGHTIEVKRGPDGQILVRHSRFDPIEFGIFRDPKALADAFAKNGFGLDDEHVASALNNFNRVCGARLELKGREHRLTKADAALIRQSVKDLE